MNNLRITYKDAYSAEDTKKADLVLTKGASKFDLSLSGFNASRTTAFTKAKILSKKLVFWPDKLIKVSVSESAKKPGVRGRRSGSLEGEPLAKSSV